MSECANYEYTNVRITNARLTRLPVLLYTGCSGEGYATTTGSCTLTRYLRDRTEAVSIHVGAKKPGFSYRKTSLAVEKCLQAILLACGATKTRFLVLSPGA